MTKKLMLGTALCALLLSGAVAQTSTGASPPPPPAATNQATPGNTAGKADFVMSQKPGQWLASKFKGTDVMGADNKKIGDVSDILFDKDGKIEAYVVSVGGFLGMGAKDVALAPSAFTVEPGQNGKPDVLRLSMSQDQIKQAQNFAPYQPPRPVTTGSAPGGRPLGGGMHPPGSRQ